jgi:hypothetical protein
MRGLNLIMYLEHGVNFQCFIFGEPDMHSQQFSWQHNLIQFNFILPFLHAYIYKEHVTPYTMFYLNILDEDKIIEHLL